MDIQASRVRELRSQRGWTQQHLADACAVSLRTIQRIEKDGNAAQETVAALCAVFSVAREELLIVPRKNLEQLQRAQFGRQWLAYALVLMIGIAIGSAMMVLLTR
jgi:transcriptional regulator with XRE-family HTH domain